MAEYRSIKWGYALNKDNVLTSILDASKTDEKEFHCLNCGDAMVKRCGEHNEFHFAHKKCKCSYETYLHNLAKTRIKQWLEKSTTIDVYFEQRAYCLKLKDSGICDIQKDAKVCCFKEKTTHYNVRKSLDMCELEKQKTIKDIIFTPDILWYSSKNENDFIFIEIFVKHECSDQKKESGARIIEFKIENEADINYIVSHNFIKNGSDVRYYGFKPHDTYDDISPDAKACIDKFIVYESGKTFSTTCTCLNYMKHNPKSIFELSIVQDVDSSYKAKNWGIAEALRRRLSVGNCQMCKFYHSNDFYDIQKCNKHKALVRNTSAAVGCNNMWLRDEYKTQYLQELSVYANDHFVHIWETENKYAIRTKYEAVKQLNEKALLDELFTEEHYPITEEEETRWNALRETVSHMPKDTSSYIDSLLRFDIAPSYLSNDYDGKSKTSDAVIRNWSESAKFPLCPPRQIDKPLAEYASRLKKGRIIAETSSGKVSILGSKLTFRDGQETIVVACKDPDNVHFHIFTITYKEGYFIHEHLKKYYQPAGLLKRYSSLGGVKWTDTFLLDDGIV